MMNSPVSLPLPREDMALELARISLTDFSVPGDEMARRRLQKNGDLYRQSGFWKLRWREDGADIETGKPKRVWSKPVWIGPCEGKGRLTEKEAQRLAWDNFLSRLDQNTSVPQSMATVQQYVERRFEPEHIELRKKSGKMHYRYMLKSYILPALGAVRLRDTKTEQIQALTSAIIRQGRSVQTAQHVKNAVSAIFTHAKSLGWFTGENPAAGVRLPEMERKEQHALTFDQAHRLIEALPSPVSEMALLAVLTSMNIAEIAGLQWKRVNLTKEWQTVDGQSLPPYSLAVRRQWYRGEYGSVKAKSRIRNIPLAEWLVEALTQIRKQSPFTEPDHPVFASRNGTPLDEHNVARRLLKPAGKRLGMPWLSWHAFRRTHATLADQLQMTLGDRMAMMGHSSAAMTGLYTFSDIERRRDFVNQIASGVRRGSVQ